jgi:hypothetical protein
MACLTNRQAQRLRGTRWRGRLHEALVKHGVRHECYAGAGVARADPRDWEEET